MNTILKIALSLCFTLSSLKGFSQEDPMKALHMLSGQWEIENYVNEQGEWKNIGNTSSTIELVHDGKFISENSKFLTAFGEINMITFIGFDGKRSQYKLSAMDKEYGLMDIYLGEWINNELIFDNINSDLPVKLEDGGEMHFRLTYKEISADSFTHLVEGSTDKGRTWFIFSKSLFKRKG